MSPVDRRTFWLAMLRMAAGLAALLILGAELIGQRYGSSLKEAVYFGGAAGAAVVGAGLPLAARLIGISGKDAYGKFWFWWGLGLMARLVAFLVMAAVLMMVFVDRAFGALLAMALFYLAAQGFETAWLARFFIKSDGTK